ncbi:protein MpHTH [Marchantia polymorpha subsp. ruderalis]
MVHGRHYRLHDAYEAFCIYLEVCSQAKLDTEVSVEDISYCCSGAEDSHTCRFATMEQRSFMMLTTSFLLLMSTPFYLPVTATSVDGRYAFVRNASWAPAKAEYDYIVVGGGAAGCPLAATLSTTYKVLVLERGGAPFDKPNVVNALNFASVLTDINDSTVSPAQGFQSQDGVLSRRARVLGGGTSINAGFYSRAEPEWVEARRLDWARVNRSYEWVESALISFPPLGPWQRAVKQGLVENGVGPDNGFTYDHKLGVKVGGTLFDETGHRRTAADLLQHAVPENIAVHLYATAHQLILDFGGGNGVPRAMGVLYTDENGDAHEAALTGAAGSEVILTAGALGSPQLLMLSGIGPSEHLKELGLPVVVDQPGVGKGMSDNPCVTMLVPSRIPLETSLIETVGILSTGFYIEAASGAISAFDEVQALNTLDPEYRSQAEVGNYSGTVPQFPPDATASISQSGVLLGKIASPQSRGTLRLNSTDVRQTPLVQFNYFGDVQDLYACVEGVRVMIQLLRASTFSNITYPRLPEPVLTWAGFVAPLAPDTLEPALLAQWCRQTVLTIWHFHGGAQEGVVVDRSYKVLGVDALRVIDGSTFNSSPGTNPQATVMMLGRYMGLEILDERSQRRKAN